MKMEREEEEDDGFFPATGSYFHKSIDLHAENIRLYGKTNPP